MELEKPKFKVEETFTKAISDFRSETKECLKKSLPAIVEAEIVYNREVKKGTVYNIEIDDLQNTYATVEQFVKTYTDKFAKKAHPSRMYYDSIMITPRAGRCPYCGQRPVSTLDHYLDKKKYPKLTVTPLNLLPVCSDCNKLKLSDKPTSPGDYYIHPYYDEIDKFEWLKAKVIYTSPLIIEFYVACDYSIEPNMRKRINYHFNKLNLKNLYTAEATNELNNKKHRLVQLFNDRGGLSVKNYLSEEFESYKKNNINSWQTAMFCILSHDEKFYMDITNWLT